ncbi:REXO2 isoform 11 [Pan troglodytes]|uniref:RNA exonuclease 2 n=4 Tax=Homininae TaxID=207598 RepID=F5H7P1_HUMAN|nr:RNA exonuclease 2 [Homo sapiens]KAI4074243.1 RNA exonuclease 2 [Homo sapiens]PNI40569.1 REXO2 isoform 11 [Pan troglodytes]
MLGGSLGSRLLRGVGGSHGRFGARGVREGGAAMAAGESMAQRMVWVDLEEIQFMKIRSFLTNTCPSS